MDLDKRTYEDGLAEGYKEAEKIAIAYAEWTVINSAFALYGFDGAFKIFLEEYNEKHK